VQSLHLGSHLLQQRTAHVSRPNQPKRDSLGR
jgi:hypothetical protein